MRVALVTNVLASYRVPCFAELASRLPDTFRIFLMSESLAEREAVLARGAGSDLPIEVLAKRRTFGRRDFDDVHLNDVGSVLAFDPDVVILGGWAEPTLLWLWARLLFKPRVRTLVWTESTRVDLERNAVREWIKRRILQGVDGALVPGTEAKRYCETLGLASRKIHVAPNATDRAFFRGWADRLLPERQALRSEFGFDAFTLLFVGRLTEAFKNVSILPEIVGRLEARGHRITLVVVGEGPDRDRVEEGIARHECRDVRLVGALEHEELARFYAAADVLVVPSRSDPWGFVLNEAMEFGLPIMATDAVGAGADLIVDGGNGRRIPVGDAEGFAEGIEWLLVDEARLAEQREASRRRIEAQSPEAWATGVLAAVASVLDVNGPR